MFKGVGVGVLTVLLAACGAPKPRPLPSPLPGQPANAPSPPPPGRTYRIDDSQSELRILVYRAGPLARLGHNHVMVNRTLHGTIKSDAAGASVFTVQVPLAAFVVDDAQARREEGADFEGEIPDDAKSGTLHNMLSAAVLDAERFPVMTIDGSGTLAGTPSVAGAAVSGSASAAINVAGHESKIAVPFTMQSDSNHAAASGSIELRQTALGLTPYSLLLGALQVQDAMTVKFHIIAVPDN